MLGRISSQMKQIYCWLLLVETDSSGGGGSGGSNGSSGGSISSRGGGGNGSSGSVSSGRGCRILVSKRINEWTERKKKPPLIELQRRQREITLGLTRINDHRTYSIKYLLQFTILPVMATRV